MAEYNREEAVWVISETPDGKWAGLKTGLVETSEGTADDRHAKEKSANRQRDERRKWNRIGSPIRGPRLKRCRK
jgi:hypothetical protein